MAQNISVADVLSAKNLIDYTSLAPVQPRVLSELFPETKQSELTIEMIRGASDKPVTAHIHAFDTEAEIGDREGFKKDIADLALIKKKIPLREKEIIALEHPRTDAEFNMVRNQVYNDVDRLVESIYTRVEAMRGEALTTGRLVINENNYRQTINYGVPNNHKGSHTWSTGTPDILGDIYTDVDTIVADTGFTPTRALTSRKVLNIILKDAKVRTAILGINKDMILTKPQLNQALAGMGLPTIQTYDEQYRDGNVAKRYFDEDTIVFMPANKLGDTLYGPTAEERQLVKEVVYATQQLGKVTVAHMTTFDPVTEWIKAAASAMITFPYADRVFIGTVS